MSEPQMLDDDLTDEVIAQSNVTAEDILDCLLEDVSSLDEDEGEPGVIYYSLWVSLTQFLALIGWTSDELCRDVMRYVNVATAEDNVQ